MDPILYNFPTVLIVFALFVAIVIGIEGGYRLGRWAQRLLVEPTKSQINAIQASMLALLALILGFTFSLSLQRYDDRANAVVDEANAIGTTYLRTDLLPQSVRADAKKLLREYVDCRVEAGSISLDQKDERYSSLVNSEATSAELWQISAEAAAEDGGPVTSGLYITALNEMIDSFGTRAAIINRCVPELVILLLMITFVLTGAVIGYASGAEDHRPSIAAHIMVLLIVLLVFIIIDLDRPRRGLIQIPQKNLIYLQSTIEAAESANVNSN